ncbi:MAG TPA: NlpC/P60 family protein [Ensifer sp.]|nr:NlpC/P60 family protein [Ensifer sp.]
MNPVKTSARILNAAVGWIGTPYRHQGSLKGVGCDCLGLIRGIWRELYDTEPEEPGPYAPDWAERGGMERLAEAALRHFGPPVITPAEPGDVLLFRFRPGAAAKHLGILAGEGRFIHAYEQAGVVASPLVPSWTRRIVAVHRFPDLG